MTKIYNKLDIKKTRQALRKNIPTPESIIWEKIRNRQLCNSKFRRQYSVGNYIVDFYCTERKLAIEIDGDSHYNAKAIEHDKKRQNTIESYGIKFLRFTNKEVTENIEGVLSNIINNLT